MNFTKHDARFSVRWRVLPLLIGVLLPASSAWSQDGVNEQRAIGGNNATIGVNVRDSAGSPLPVSAMVKLFQSQGIPNGQATTSQGRVICLPQNLGGFFVVVEAPATNQDVRMQTALIL